MIWKIIKSLLIITIISGAGGWVFATTIIGFWKVFTALTVAQLFIGTIFKSIMAYLYTKMNNEYSLSKIREYSKQGLNVVCPCGQEAFVPILLDSANAYECSSCKKNVSVVIEHRTFVQTDMIDVNMDLQKAFDEARKDIDGI